MNENIRYFLFNTSFVNTFFLMFSKKQESSGFTLIELLVVVAIIGILAALVLVSVGNIREKAMVAEVAAKVKDMTTATQMYLNDTEVFPAACRLDCTAATDPFLTSMGVYKWGGPYYTIWNLTHSWGGHIGFTSGIDYDGDGIADTGVVFDDDRPGTSSTDNQGRIPTSALERLDKIFDDGDLSTGNMRGDTQGYSTGVGEAFYFIDDKVN